jgi:predicted metal-binding membrane protein
MGGHWVQIALHLVDRRQAAWIAFFVAVLGAWAALFLMQPDLDLPAGWQALGLDYLASLCRPAADTSLAGLIAMWGLMSLAMMAPTVAPALKTYLDLTHTQGATITGFSALLAGYLLVWIGFSVPAALLQAALDTHGWLDPFGRSSEVYLTAGLLALAGAYQFSRLKEACLNQCQSPLMFFMGKWQDGLSGAFRMGLHLGAICLGCCWALMLLAFVAGTMNLAFMGLAMVLMTFEKLPQLGRYLTVPVGFALLGSAAAILIIELIKHL